MIPAHILRASLDDALEVVALTDTAKGLGTQALADIMALPEPQRERVLALLHQCWILNAEIMAAGQRLSARMDELARVAHQDQVGSTVKALAADLRPHLTLIADPSGYGTAAYIDAVCALNDLIEATPFDRLAGGGLRRALGPGRHALLMGFVKGQAEPILAAGNGRTRPAKQAGPGIASPPLLTQRIAREKTPAGRAGGEAIGSPTAIGPDGLATSLEVAA